MTGMPPSTPRQLTRASDRVSFLDLEHCTIGRDGGALTATDDDGVLHVPVSALSVLLLGPGTRLTHQAVGVVADSACSLVWVGEQGVRYYAHGRSIARSDRMLRAQAEKVTSSRKRLDVARRMYAMRFPGEDTSGLTMQQLRGKEGARVRKAYRECAAEYGVRWVRRDYDSRNFLDSDPINQALSAANTCLYGLAHSVIVALGCSPGLGFVHTGHDRSFVYDLADLYKAEVSVPVAFRTVAALEREGRTVGVNIGSVTRRAMRDEFRTAGLAETMSRDLRTLLLDDEVEESDLWADVIGLWDGRDETVAGGVNYAPEDGVDQVPGGSSRREAP